MWEKVLSILGGNVFEGVKDIVRTFKLPPEQQLQFDSKMAELQTTAEIKLAELEASDRNSARQREMSVKDNTNANLAYTVTGTMMVGLVYFNMYPPAPEVKTVVENVMMAVRDGWLVILAYYFGSSRGSAAKHDMIDKLVTK
jgi:hypothetical protein